MNRANTPRRRSGIGATLAVLTGIIAVSFVAGATPVHAANAVQAENLNAGTDSWQIPEPTACGGGLAIAACQASPPNTLLAERREIEGYASATSVPLGGPISFMVSTRSTISYYIQIYRLGWYSGLGGRLMTPPGASSPTIGPLSGSQQPTPTIGPSPDFLIESNWPVAYTLNVPPTWTSGYYVVKLIRADGYERYVPFTVRNDASTAAILMQASVTTWQAYNWWGGKNLYGSFNVNVTSPSYGLDIPGPAAGVVSFDRPYGNSDYTGWELEMMRYLESQGRDVTYATDVDLHSNPNLLLAPRHAAFLSVGHDEYWSSEMRTNVINARDHGVHLGFFGANAAYFRIKFAADAGGSSNRRIVCYKNPATDPATIRWRDQGLPENALIGEMSDGAADSNNYVVSNAASWIWAGTGLRNGSVITGLVGYEYDRTWVNGATPAGLQVVAHSPTRDGSFSESSVYTAPSGAIVFAAGTIQWASGLDDYRDSWANAGIGVAVSPPLQKATANILDRLSVPPPPPPPPPTVSGITPASGPAAGGTVVSISGTNFNTTAGSTTVAFGGVAATAVTCSSTSACSATSPAGSGTVDVTLTVSGQTSATSAADQFTYPGPPVPTVSAISPTGGPAAGGTVVAITGTNFSTTAGATTVGFGGQAGSAVNCTSTTSCTATSPPGTGLVNLTVTVGGQTSPVNASDQFTYDPGAGLVFSDGFESGTLGQWDTALGTGSASAVAAAAHTGNFGARLANTASGQYSVLVKHLSTPLDDSYTRFSVRFTGTAAATTVAYGRDDSSSAIRWVLYYDRASQSFSYYLFNSSGVSTGITTANGVAPLGAWTTVELRYTGTTTGGGQIWVNGISRPGWSLTGNYASTQPYQRVQLWNDALGTTDFDDVTVSTSQTAALPPTVSAVSPANGPATGGTVVTVSGTGFSTTAGATAVNFGSAAATAISCASVTSCTATSPAGTGPVDVTVAVGGQTSATGPADQFTYPPPPPPAVSAIDPNTGPAGGGTTVTITGSGFSTAVGATTIHFGATTMSAVCTSTSSCNATSPAGTGTVDITVTVGVQTSVTSAGDQFTYIPGVVFSDGFGSGTLAQWDGALGSGSTSVLAAAARTGSFGVRLADSASGQYAVLVKQLPTSLSDSYTRFAVRFTGTTGLTTVAYGRDDSSSTNRWILYYDPATQAFTYYLFNGSGVSTGITTASGVAPVGAWTTVELRYTGTATGGGQIWINGATQPAWSISGNFATSAPYQRLQLWNDAVGATDFDDVSVSTIQTATPPPTVSALSPNSGPAAGGTLVTISGSNLTTTTDPTTVSFGGVPGTGVSCASPSSCSVTSPAGAGAVDVRVTVGAQTSATGSADQFSYPPPPPPTVSGITPASGAAAGGTVVTITGTNFSTLPGGTTVSFGSAAGTAVSCPSSTSCSVSSPAGSGAVDVTATVSGQRSATSPADQFSYAGTLFSDGFESGTLAAWDGALGPGSTTVLAAAARTGNFGARLSDSAAGQYAVLVKRLPTSLDDSFTRFNVRFTGTAGLTTVAYGRDDSSSTNRWILYYDPSTQAFQYYLFNGSGVSTGIQTANAVAPLNTWVTVELRYTGTTTGGGQIWVNGVSQPSWSVSGNFSNSAPYQRLQLWNDATGTTDFDDVTVGSNQTAAPLPIVSGLSPTSGPAAGGTVVTISGSNFSTAVGATTVNFGGVGATAVSCSSSTTCSATSPAGSGPVDVTVSAGGQASALSPADRFTYPPPAAPSISSIGPSSGPAAGGTVVAINGSNFATAAGATTVSFGSAAGTAVSCSSSSACSATSPAGSGTADVRVTVAGQTSPMIAADQFSFTPGAIFTDGFESGTLAAWNGGLGSGSTSVLAAAAATGNFGARLANTAAGQYAVLVKRLPTSLDDSFTRFSVRFTGITAVTAVAYGRDDSSGANRWILYYDPSARDFIYYLFNGSGVSTGITTANGSAPLNAWITVELRYTGTATGGGQIWVNGASQPSWAVSGNFSNSAPYQRLQLWNETLGSTDFDDVSVSTGQSAPPATPVPTVSGLSPTSGPGSGGTAVTVTGTNFSTTAGATTISFGGIAGAGVNCVSTSSCAVTSPAGAGAVDVTVTVGGQTSATTTADQFSYPPPPPPTVSGISPSSGPAAGGTVVTITGANFSTVPSGTTVNFGGAAGTAVTCSTTSSCTATSPAGSGTVDITAAVAGQTSGLSAADQFNYTPGIIFSDGFESGTLAAWDGAQGPGSTTVAAAAARTGSFGARLTNSTAGQFALVVKRLPTSLPDSYTRFNVRFAGAAGTTTVAQGRDDSSSTTRWVLLYDPSAQAFSYYVFSGSGVSTGITTANGTAPLNTWLTVELRYTGTATGGGQIWINDVSQPAWSLSGNFSNSAPFQRLQLWNDAVGTTDFDDASVSTAQTAPPPPPTPIVSGITPTGGPAAGGTGVTISGSNFSTAAGATTVAFGSAAGTAITCASTTSCSATSPAGTGTVDLRVTVGGQVSATGAADQFTYAPPPAPTVTGISPANGPSAGATAVTITGTGFVNTGTTVAFGTGAGTTVSCPSSTSCSATSPAGSGTVDVRVTVAGQTSPTSPADQFAYNAPPPPTVTGISPSGGPAAGGTVVTITGTNFDPTVGATTVAFGGNAALVSCASASSCSATSPAGTGTVDVRVTVAGQSSATGAADQFTYTPGVIFNDGFESGTLAAWDGAQGSGSTTVVAAAARTGNFGARLTNASAGQFALLLKRLPTALDNSYTRFTVRFTGSSGVTTVAYGRDDSSSATRWVLFYDPASQALNYNIFNGSGASTGITTTNGSVPLNTWVTVELRYTGTATGGGQIWINDLSQPGWSVSGNFANSAPYQRLQLWNDVVATTDFDDVSVSTAQTAPPPLPAPVVSAISPAGGPAAGGTTIAITGNNFGTSGTTVAFGGAAATGVTCASSTSCSATSPAGSGTVDVRVALGNQTSATSAADQFTYAAPPPPPGPVVSAISPTGGPAAGGTVVSITGSNFSTTGTTVSFGTAAGSAVSCVSSTSCSATSPAGSGTVDVTVSAGGQTSATSAADQFAYAAAPPPPVPTVSAIDPASGPGAGGTVVSITGTNFSTAAGATAVRFGTAAATAVSCSSATTCRVTSPAGSGAVDVTVSAGGQTSATSAADLFSYVAGMVFSDGFESGTLAQWDGTIGSGATTVVAAAARTGAFGARLVNGTTADFAVLVKQLPTSLDDSYTRLSARFTGTSGLTTVAHGRDDSSSVNRWILYYNPATQSFIYYLFNGSGVSTQITTPNGIAPLNTWVTVELRYTGTAIGGGQIWINDVTQPAWSVTGDFSNSAPYRRLQLWNEVIGTTDFDDVTVSTRQTAP